MASVAEQQVLLQRLLAEDGFDGVECLVTPSLADFIIRGYSAIAGCCAECSCALDKLRYASVVGPVVCLYKFLQRTFAGDGYTGFEAVVTPSRTEVVIHAKRTSAVWGVKGSRIREVAAFAERSFALPLPIEFFAMAV